MPSILNVSVLNKPDPEPCEETEYEEIEESCPIADLPHRKPRPTFSSPRKYIAVNRLRTKDRNSTNVTMALKCPEYYSEEEKTELRNNKTKNGRKFYCSKERNNSDQLRQILQPELFSNDFQDIDGWMKTTGKMTAYRFQIPQPFAELYETLQRKSAKEKPNSRNEVHHKGKKSSPVDAHRVVCSKKTSRAGQSPTSKSAGRAKWNRLLPAEESLEMVKYSLKNSSDESKHCTWYLSPQPLICRSKSGENSVQDDEF